MAPWVCSALALLSACASAAQSSHPASVDAPSPANGAAPCAVRGPLLGDDTGPIVEVAALDLNGDGRLDRVLAEDSTASPDSQALRVVARCDDGERVVLRARAPALRAESRMWGGWRMLRSADAAPSSTDPSAGLWGFSANHGMYVPALILAKDLGCPVYGHGIVSLTREGERAVLDGAAHRVTWTGDLDGDQRPDFVLVEDGSGSPGGETYRVVAGCDEGQAAIVLDEVLVAVTVEARTKGFATLRLTRAQMSGAPPADELATIPSRPVGIYLPSGAN
ncbi:MAG: hypothetical protein R3F39_07365 [Myxococcota bacterium]